MENASMKSGCFPVDLLNGLRNGEFAVRVELCRGVQIGREGFEKFVTSSKTGSPVVVLQDEVCFLNWVPCGRQGLIKDRPVMAAILESSQSSYFFLCGRRWVK